MKIEKVLPISLLVVIVGIVLFLGSCSAGMTKLDRLEAFKADIIAVDNPREHFEGHTNAASIDYAAVTTIDLDNNSGNLVFTGQNISGDLFSLDFTIGISPYSVDGSFFNAGSGGLGGDDWYIFQMTNGVNTIP